MTDSALVELAQDFDRYVPARAFSRLIHGLATGIGYALLGAAAVGFVHDRMLASESLEMHDNVQVLADLRRLKDVALGPELAQDFNGDGVVDPVAIIEYDTDPVFGRGTTHLLQIYSGRTHELLLAHGIIWPTSFRGWYGDYDQNGTMDLVVRKRGSNEVLGYVKETE